MSPCALRSGPTERSSWLRIMCNREVHSGHDVGERPDRACLDEAGSLGLGVLAVGGDAGVAEGVAGAGCHRRFNMERLLDRPSGRPQCIEDCVAVRFGAARPCRSQVFGEAVDGGGWWRTLRLILAIEGAFPILSEGSEPDVLPGLVVLLMAIIAPAPLSRSDTGPARRPVDGAGVARGLDEGLDEHGRGVVAPGPVLGQAAAHDGEDVRAEVVDMDSGQDQEPRVVDHQRQVLLAQFGRPSDEVVARGELPRGG